MEHERNNSYREELKNSGQASHCKYHTANVPNRHRLSSVLIENTSFQVSRRIGQKKVLSLLGQSMAMLRLRHLSV